MTRLTEMELRAALSTHEVISDTGATDMRKSEAHKAMAAYESEAAAAVRFWKWVTDHEAQYPALRWLTHHEAGGYRPDGVAARLRREGQRPGFPDYALYWANGGFAGWAMELKRADGTNHDTFLQRRWLLHLEEAGWQSLVCYGADEAIEALKEYLEC